MSDKINNSVKRIIMAREVAASWLERRARSEYRMKIYCGCIDNLPNLLRSLRDRKVAIPGIPLIPDLGIREEVEYIEVWSSNEEGIKKLTLWLNQKGIDNDSIWM